MILLRTRSLILLSVISAFFISIAHTQTPPAAAQSTPLDAVELMKLAPEVNGLNTPAMKPWHVKVTYQTYDEQGKPKDHGIFEEWWAAPDKDKRIYSSSNFNQTDYTTSSGRFRTGDATGPPLAEFLVRERLVNPMPGEKDSAGAEIRRRENPFPKSKLSCVELARPMKNEFGSPVGLFPTYCFDSEKPMLRFSGSFGMLNTIYERMGQLDGHYLGTDIEITDQGKPFVTAHLVEGNLLQTVNDADFTPPANATMLPGSGHADVDGTVIAVKKIRGSAPVYPTAAKSAHIEGRVELSALIGEDGRIHELQIKSAPDPLLAISALIAVRDWTYVPYQLNGHPVEVTTEINVIYTMRR